jgi:hypothetical protein
MKTLKNLLKSILLILFLTNPGYSQTNISASVQDSAKENSKSEYKLRFNNNSNNFSPLSSLKLQAAFDEYSDFILPTFEQKPLNQNISVIQIRNEMNQAMQIYRAGTIKNDLGFVGKILGYTSAAAAVGLAAYHVSKFHKNYGIK